MLLFWSIFDGIISYISPLVIVDEGFTNTAMGAIIGSSSVAGAIFDFLLSKYLTSAHWRRLYIALFAICFVYPLILWQAKTVPLYLIAMAIWGLYYDLLTFANFDFVSRETPSDEHHESFGVISVFKSLGYLLAPIMVGFVIADKLNWKPFALSWAFLLTSFVMLIIMNVMYGKKNGGSKEHIYKPLSFIKEIYLWKKLGIYFLPFLLFALVLSMQDAFFWTIGPLMSETFTQFKPFDGLFLTMYTLPTLIFGWFVGHFVDTFGKRRTALLTFGLSFLFLSFFAFFTHPLPLLFLIFFSSAFSTVTWAVEGGMIADYIEDHEGVEKEVEGLEDTSINLGYVFGPMLAGFAADKIGYFGTFSLLGVIGLTTLIIISVMTSKKYYKMK
jgi:MFS family permease